MAMKDNEYQEARVQLTRRGLLAAGALLTPGKRVRSGELWAGSPARCLRGIGDAERAVIARTVPRYVGLAAEYRSLDQA